jgi:hypothetical protein
MNRRYLPALLLSIGALCLLIRLIVENNSRPVCSNRTDVFTLDAKGHVVDFRMYFTDDKPIQELDAKYISPKERK